MLPFDPESFTGCLFVTNFTLGGVIWRPLKFDHFLSYTRCISLFEKLKPEIEDAIYKKSVVYSQFKDIDHTPAGVVSTIANLVLTHSGFQSIEELNSDISTAGEQGIFSIPEVVINTVALYLNRPISEVQNMSWRDIAAFLAPIQAQEKRTLFLPLKENDSEPKRQAPGNQR